MRFRARPGHLFGTIGLAFGMIGMLILTWLGVDKFLLGNNIGGRPLLLAGVLLVITSIQFLTTGIIAEMLARVYFESSNRDAYVIRPDREEAVEHDWYKPT